LETSTPTKAKNALRAINVFFYSMIGGMLMFTIIIIALNFLQTPALFDQSLVRIFFIVVLVIAGISILMAPRLYKKRITDASSQGLTLMDKLTIYRSALILYLALCEGAGLFAVIVYFLTGYNLLLIIIGVVLLAMLMKRPEKSKIFNELQLSSHEQLELN
jgi:uncharacterized protein YjeT (DUF2065 family)